MEVMEFGARRGRRRDIFFTRILTPKCIVSDTLTVTLIDLTLPAKDLTFKAKVKDQGQQCDS